MIKISVEEFKTLPHKQNYIFFFTIPGMCSLCKVQTTEYEKFPIPDLIMVEGTITDENFLMQADIQALPCTIIYNKDGSEKVKKYGVQYQKQIDELLKEFNKDEK